LLRSAQVALKTAVIYSCGDELEVRHLQQEMKINDKISDYTHIIQVFDHHIVRWGDDLLLLQSMEYANGKTFRQWLNEHKKDLKTRQEEGLAYFKQVCRGVDSIHQAKAVHLDLKPENLLFCDQVLKVSDFGAAMSEAARENLSQAGLEAFPFEQGTALYMSPEQFIAPHPDDIDGRSDIYSLGIILYELLHPNCRQPFFGSFRRLRELHLEIPAPRLPDAGNKINEIVACCLEKAPGNRFQTVDDLLDALSGKPSYNINPDNETDPKTDRASDFLEETWQNATLCYTQGNFKKAAVLSNEILKIQPDHTQATGLKEELKDRFDRADGFYKEITLNLEGDLFELFDLLEETIGIYPDHPSGHLVQAKLGIKAKQYRKAMEEGLDAMRKEHWETALNWYHKALEHHPTGENLCKVIDRLSRIEDMKQKIEVTIQQRDLDTALYLGRSVDECIEEMKDCLPAFKQSTEHYED